MSSFVRCLSIWPIMLLTAIFVASCASASHIEPSSPSRASFPPPTLHVVAVGVNEYKNPNLNLTHARQDAEGIRDFFHTMDGVLYAHVKVHELYDREATKDGILVKLQELRSAREDDVVVVYFSGHGDTVGDHWYFIPHEVVHPEGGDALEAQGFSSAELQEQLVRIKAQKIVVLLDTAKSGAALDLRKRGIEQRRVLMELPSAPGIHIAAVTTDDWSHELSELRHGLFTYVVLQGLQGKADTGSRDGIVTVRELLDYVDSSLPALSERYKKTPQYPVVYSLGVDFPLAVVR